MIYGYTILKDLIRQKCMKGFRRIDEQRSKRKEPLDHQLGTIARTPNAGTLPSG